MLSTPTEKSIILEITRRNVKIPILQFSVAYRTVRISEQTVSRLWSSVFIIHSIIDYQTNLDNDKPNKQITINQG